MLLQLQLHLAQRVASRRTRRIGLPRAAFARAQQRTQGCDTELQTCSCSCSSSARTWPSAWPRANAAHTPCRFCASAAAHAGRAGGRAGSAGRLVNARGRTAGRGVCPLPALAEGAARCPAQRWPRGLPAARDGRGGLPLPALRTAPSASARTGPSAWPRAPGPRPNAAHSPCRSLCSSPLVLANTQTGFETGRHRDAVQLTIFL